MKITKSFLRLPDLHQIYYELYEPADPIGHVHIIHGMAEHIGRYEEFAHFLAMQGFKVSGHDQRGHGKTAERNGVKGYFADNDGFTRVVADVEGVLNTLRADAEELPLIIFGHSMGSFVARRFIQLHSGKVDRVVLSGSGGNPGAAGKAGLAAAVAAAKFQGKTEISPLLGKLVFGGFMKQFKGEKSSFAWLSRDASEVAKYEMDPFCGNPSTNQFYVDLFSGLGMISQKNQLFKIRSDLPILLISGSNDPVGNNGKGIFQAAEEYRKAGLTKVKVYLAEEGRHELLHELDRKAHFRTIADWMLGYD